MARREKDQVEQSQELPTEETPVDEQEERGEGQTQEEAAGETKDAGFGGGEDGEADVRYSPGAETINPAFVARNQAESDN
jgi:hypothetical protein